MSTRAVYDQMKQRCFNKNNPMYNHYGGRGITICERWVKNYKNFLEDMGEQKEFLTLDRIDNSKGYSKENCRWAFSTIQNNNTRRNHFFEFNNLKLTLTGWSKVTGIKRSTLSQRYHAYKWSIEKTLTFQSKKIMIVNK